MSDGYVTHVKAKEANASEPIEKELISLRNFMPTFETAISIRSVEEQIFLDCQKITCCDTAENLFKYFKNYYEKFNEHYPCIRSIIKLNFASSDEPERFNVFPRKWMNDSGSEIYADGMGYVFINGEEDKIGIALDLSMPGETLRDNILINFLIKKTTNVGEETFMFSDFSGKLCMYSVDDESIVSVERITMQNQPQYAINTAISPLPTFPNEE